MKKMKKQRKGFTLTELAIVIAVIAILIAVLVPTFTSLISKANESADKQMIKNINTTLITEDTISGISTPSDALDAVEEVGYSLEKLTPTSEDNYIVYDQTTKTFALLDSDGNTLYSYNDVTIDSESPSTWWIVSSTSEMTSTTRSYILTGDIASTASASTSGVNLAKTSVNGGHKAAASSMSYDSDGVLTYTGFGGIDTYNVTSNITKVVYDFSNASVAEKYASYYDTNNFVININIPATLVEIKTSVSLVIDSHGAEDTVVKVTASSGATVTVNDYSGALYVESSSVTVTSATTTTVTTITETEYSSASTSSGTLELGNEQYPWLIESVDELKDISGTSSKGVYYKLANDLTLSHSKYLISSFYGTLDGDGHYIYGLGGDGSTLSYLFNYLYGATIKNLNVQYECTIAGEAGMIAYYISASGNYKETTFDSVDTYGTLNYTYGGRNQSPYMYQVKSTNATLTFENCNNYADISFPSNGYNAAFVGYAYYGKIIIKDCNNYGYISGGNAGVVVAGKPSDWLTSSAYSSSTITVDNVKNYASVVGTVSADLFCWQIDADTEEKVILQNGGITNATDTVNKYYGACYILGSLSGLSISADSDGQIVITPADTQAASTYLVSISSLGSSYYSNGSYYGSSNMTISSTISASDITGSSYKTGLYNYKIYQTDTAIPSGVTANYALASTEYEAFTADEAALGYKVITINDVNYYLISDLIYKC